MQRVVVESGQIQDNLLSLTANQQHYLSRVLRLRAGDRFLALDGAGHLWLATLLPHSQQATLSIPPDSLTATVPGSAPWIILAACLPKQGFDEVVRQVTELGVDQIVPILSDRTLLRPSPNKIERWRRIATEAAEQSERLTVPVLNDPTDWLQWLSQERDSQRYLCVARHDAAPWLAVCLAASSPRIVVATGPEGGWTEAEIAAAIAMGYSPVSLGKRILRAVTAPMVALAVLQSKDGFASMDAHEVMKS